MTVSAALTSYSTKEAQAEAKAGRFLSAVEWLDRVETKLRPAELERELLEGAIRETVAAGAWAKAIELVERRLRLGEDRLLRLRLNALRARRLLMDDAQWRAVASKVPVCARLPSDSIAGIAGVWAAGAYHSRGTHRGAPWSRLVRAAKDPSEVEDGWAMLGIACRYAARYVATRTPILGFADAVVAIPARPVRYVDRMMALPDELAKAFRDELALPYVPEALISTADELEMKHLSWADRRAAIRDSIAPSRIELLRGRTVLVVDDITTSGETLAEAARQLRLAGIAVVYAFALAHTEG